MIWEMATGIRNEFAVLVAAEEGNIWSRYFRTNGKPLHWDTKPAVIPFIDPKRKKQKPRGDIEYLTWGAIVLNERAYQALQATLLPFGQFLPLACLGETLYFYNVTTLRDVVDYDNSEKIEGQVTKPQFLENSIPDGFCIFKDPLIAPVSIYLNDETKNSLEQLIAHEKLTGLYFIPAGSF